MSYLFYLFIFLFGLVIGSFLNVVICRLETGEGIVKKRSHCVKCGQTLTWYELIPIVSFLYLRGRCRSCGKKISWQYPLVEIATGLLFVAIAQYLVILSVSEGSLAENVRFFASLRMTDYINFTYYLFVVSSLIVIFVYDLRHYIIPDVVLFPAIGAAFVYRIVEVFFNPFLALTLIRGGKGWGGLWYQAIVHFSPYLLSALGASAFFLAIILITRGKGMGLGDAKLTFLMGLILGWPNILVALLLAFFMGATVGVFLVFWGSKTMKSQIPFGPFLIIGTLIALFWGQGIINWYWGLFQF